MGSLSSPGGGRRGIPSSDVNSSIINICARYQLFWVRQRKIKGFSKTTLRKTEAITTVHYFPAAPVVASMGFTIHRDITNIKHSHFVTASSTVIFKTGTFAQSGCLISHPPPPISSAFLTLSCWKHLLCRFLFSFPLSLLFHFLSAELVFLILFSSLQTWLHLSVSI